MRPKARRWRRCNGRKNLIGMKRITPPLFGRSACEVARPFGFSPSLGSRTSPGWTMITRMRSSLNSGEEPAASRTKSLSAPAVSTPEKPPPAVTKVSNCRRAESSVCRNASEIQSAFNLLTQGNRQARDSFGQRKKAFMLAVSVPGASAEPEFRTESSAAQMQLPNSASPDALCPPDGPPCRPVCVPDIPRTLVRQGGPAQAIRNPGTAGDI